MSPIHISANGGPASLDLTHMNTSNDSLCPSPTASRASGSIFSPTGSSKVLPRKRRTRAPLADKSLEYNNISNSRSGGTNPCLPLAETARSLSSNKSKRCRTSSSIHPLPHLPPAASTQAPSYLDFTFQTFSLSPGTTALHIPSSNTPHSLPPTLPPLPPVSRFRPSDFLQSETSRGDLFQIPAFNHPNSPYVPWASRLRHQILRPTSPVSRASVYSGYSRPHSRSGAQAPEPPDLSEVDARRPKLLKVTESCRKLRRSVTKNFSSVVRRISNLKTSFILHPKAEVTPEAGQTTHVLAYGVYTPKISTPSAASFETSNTNSLATWLAERQQEMKDWELEQSNHISLEDYERQGSWIDLSHNSAGCHIAGCEAHSPRRSEDAPTDTTTNESSILRLLLESEPGDSLRSFGSTATPRSPMSESDQSDSLDPSLSQSTITYSALHSNDMVAHSSVFIGSMSGGDHTVEVDMPGGWA